MLTIQAISILISLRPALGTGYFSYKSRFGMIANCIRLASRMRHMPTIKRIFDLLCISKYC